MIKEILEELNKKVVDVGGVLYIDEDEVTTIVYKKNLDPEKMGRVFEALEMLSINVIYELDKFIESAGKGDEILASVKDAASAMESTIEGINLDALDTATKNQLLLPIDSVISKLNSIRQAIKPQERIVGIRTTPSSSGNAGITERAILIRINQLYHDGISSKKLYDITRSAWRVGQRREMADYAFAVFGGVIVEAYKINYWEVCTQHNSPHDWVNNKWNEAKDGGRFQFVGSVDEAMSKKYRNKSVKELFTKGNANPIQYVNI